MTISEAAVRRSDVRSLDVAAGVLLGGALAYATAVSGYAWSNNKNVVEGSPVVLLTTTVAVAALCAFLVMTRPGLGLVAGTSLLIVAVIGRLTWTSGDVVAFDPWSFDAQTWIGYASFQLLTWALATVLIVAGVMGRTRRAGRA